MKNLKGTKKGFTLIELIVVIAIIGILAAIALPRLAKYLDDADARRLEANARNVYTAAAAFDGISNETTNIDTSYTFETMDLQDYLDSNVVILPSADSVDTSANNKAASVTVYRKDSPRTDLPTTLIGTVSTVGSGATETINYDVYVVTVSDGTNVYNYAY